MRQWALYYKHRTAQDLAVYLAFKTRRRRARLQMRPDDVTVTVIDVNPHQAFFTKSNRTKPDALYQLSAASAATTSTTGGINTVNSDGALAESHVDESFPQSSVHSMSSSVTTERMMRQKPLTVNNHLITSTVPGKTPLAVLTSTPPVNSSIDNTFAGGMEETIVHYTLRQPNATPCSIM